VPAVTGANHPYGLVSHGGAVLHRAMRASVIQFEAGVDKTANIAAAAALIEASVSHDGATLVSLPEMWSCLGGDRAAKALAAEVLPPNGGGGEAYAFLRDTARRHGITVHGGSIGESAEGTLFNTSLLFGPDGGELARYRKIHMFDITTPSGQGYRESSLFGAGASVVVGTVPPTDAAPASPVRMGLSICYDLRFPELFLALRRQGAEVIFVPSAFTAETGRDHWEVLLRARAIETQSWIVAAATTGRHADAQGRPRETWGHSMIIDPWGQPRAILEAAPGHAAADIDLAQLARVRNAMPVLQHRRLV
jgi:nitrilase